MFDTSRNVHLIQALALFTTQIKTHLHAMPDDMLVWQPADDEWSIRMVLAHLVHCELLFRKRLQRVVREENPAILGFGPDEAPPISSHPAKKLLIELDTTRKLTLDQIYTYTTDDWQRPAVHSVMGETTLQEQIQLIVMHDTEHLGQMVDLVDMWQSQETELL